MKHKISFFSLILVILSANSFFFSQESLSKKISSPEKTFRLHLSTEPLSLDPSKQKGASSLFLLNSLFSPLFKSDFENPFQPSILKQCQWTKTALILNCQLVPGLKWSNGQPLTSEHIKKSFDYLMTPQSKNRNPELVHNIKAVRAPKAAEVIFELQSKEPRFMEKLTSQLLSPIYDTQFPPLHEMSKLVTSGPYKIDRWQSKSKISLVPNTFYKGHPQRPNVDFYIITEESTALRLYENHQLDFLRRLPTAYIDRYQSTPDFKQAPIARFDYIGFGPALDQEPELRMQLSHSLDYQQWSQFLRARGRPGCFGIALDLTSADPCLNFEPEHFSLWKKALAQRIKPLPNLTLHYSTLGGDDHKKSMEWIQNEWMKNLNLKVSVKGVENANFQKMLHENPPTLFRLGVPLQHLSCFNALSSFINMIPTPLIFKQKQFIDKLEQLNQIRTQANSKKSEDALCSSLLNELIDKHWIIPLGRIHLSFLIKPEWQGWSLSPLNTLDLSNLHWSKKTH